MKVIAFMITSKNNAIFKNKSNEGSENYKTLMEEIEKNTNK